MTEQVLLRSGATALLAFVLAGCSGTSRGADKASAEVRGLTGAHTRVVWVQGDGTDPRATGDQLVLMGLDSDDGRGARVILGKLGSYVKPMLTPRGDRVIFSSRPVPGPPEVFIVAWDGTGLRKLADGYAMSVWEDPGDRGEWVYVGTEGNPRYEFATITRFPIDAPARREVVWNRTLVAMDGFQVSADGRYASGLCRWPDAMIAELPNGSMTKLGQGCWTSLSAARGRLFWYFDGPHRNLTLVDVDTDTRWMVNINDAPGFDGAEVYHPRWTNHPRFLVISGPYNQGGPNQARTGGKQAEVYLGRFSADYARVEAWARVTNDDRGDTYPDAWVDAGRSPHARRPAGPVGPASARTTRTAAGTPGQADAGRLVLNVRLTRPGPIPTPESILPYRHALVVNEYEVVDVLEGRYAEPTIQIAQWAIRDSRVIPAARKSAGAGFTLKVERYDAHPELEGERLISVSGTSHVALYYDVATQ